jgi:hypothetical protein
MAPQSILNFLTARASAFSADGFLVGQTAAAIYASHYGIFEIIGLLLTIAFAIGAVIHAKRLNWFKSRMDKWRHVVLNADPAREQTKRSWKDIERHFFAGDDNDLKIAIIEADKSLDNALRNAGVMGATLGDRLKKVRPAQLPNVEEVWQAHKLRNQIAHEDTMVLKRDVAERALTVYKQALQTLGALDKEATK